METAGKPSAMRHVAQLLNVCIYHTQSGTTQTQRVAGTRQPGDGITKLFGPTDHWRAAIYSMGWSQPLEDIRTRVRQLYGSRPRGQNRNEEQAMTCTVDREFEEAHGGKNNRQLSAWQIQCQRDDEESEEEAMDDEDYTIERERAARAKLAATDSLSPSNAGQANGIRIRALLGKENTAKEH
jgi:hypothetical protein